VQVQKQLMLASVCRRWPAAWQLKGGNVQLLKQRLHAELAALPVTTVIGGAASSACRLC
jgi:hypothetical protein